MESSTAPGAADEPTEPGREGRHPRLRRIPRQMYYGKPARKAMSAPWEMLPIELMEVILNHLSRLDAQSLRRVSRTFESKVSPFFFRSVVVPFNSELQDMVKRDIQARNGEFGKGKGKRLAVDDDLVIAEHTTLPWMKDPVKQHDPYQGYGYKVFRSFGQHIRQFGMTFEVTEDDLRRSPAKQLMDQHVSYYGPYEWPPATYRRFDKLASLERTADEISHLRDAMAHLTSVRALGLSLNNGHGWLAGSDSRIDARPNPPPAIFRKRSDDLAWLERQSDFDSPSAAGARARRRASEALRLVQDRLEMPRDGPRDESTSAQPRSRRHHATATDEELTAAFDVANYALDPRSLQRLDRLRLQRFIAARAQHDPQHVQVDQDYNLADFLRLPDGGDDQGYAAYQLAVANNDSTDNDTPSSTCNLDPSRLTQTQKEWLLEADWAQRAFLQSFMLSFVDNTAVFGNITTFNLACLSSRYMPMLCRQDFWNAFVALTSLSIHVSPDWRQMERMAHEIIDARLTPSKAVDLFYLLLHNFLGGIETLTELEVGWCRVAEDRVRSAPNYCHFLPAPICTLNETFAGAPTIVDLPYVQHLKLTNCYINPQTLTRACIHLQEHNLTALTLNNAHLVARRSGQYLQQNVPIETTPASPRQTFTYDDLFSVPVVRMGSWMSTLNDLVPPELIVKLIASEEGKPVPPSKLQRIEVYDCGYVICSASPDDEIDQGSARTIGPWHMNGILPGLDLVNAGAPNPFPPNMTGDRHTAQRLAPSVQDNFRLWATGEMSYAAAVQRQQLQAQQVLPAEEIFFTPVSRLLSVQRTTSTDEDTVHARPRVGGGRRALAPQDRDEDEVGVMCSPDPFLANLIYEEFSGEQDLLRLHFGISAPGEEQRRMYRQRMWLIGDGPRFSGRVVANG